MKRGAANNGTERYKIKIFMLSGEISPAASRLARRENILPNSAFVTHLDNIDLIMMEENAERNPLTEPANSTHPENTNINLVMLKPLRYSPFQAILMMTRLMILEHVARMPIAASGIFR